MAGGRGYGGQRGGPGGGGGARGGGGGRRDRDPAPRFPLPPETARCVEQAVRTQEKGWHHTGLWFDRYMLRDAADDWSFKGEFRHKEFERLCGRTGHHSEAAVAAIARRIEGLTPVGTADAPRSALCYARLVARAEGRLLIDYGRTTAYEFSLAFHHTYGCPKIPATALKGALRSALESQGAAQSLSERILGTSTDEGGGQRGCVTLLDGLPKDGAFRMAPDVLTPHVSPYYQERTERWDGQPEEMPPADWMQPVPSTFVTVGATTFVIDLVADAADQEALIEARDALRFGLENLGVGAKVGAGYGYFSVEAR